MGNQRCVSLGRIPREVANTLKKKNVKLLVFPSDKVLQRVEKMGDLFEPVETLKQKLPKKWDL